uniref:Uncharacterized protein n=1 Tax=Anopheles darlingi TaxID=43151 RepID=A0A675B3P1_ANODA
MRVEMNLDVQRCDEDIESRVAEFKQDSDKMHELNLFLDSVLEEAQKNAEVKLQDKMDEERPKNAKLSNKTILISPGQRFHVQSVF